MIWVESDPARMGGIPCVRGTRVPVEQVVDLLSEFTDERIVSFYPTVPVEAVAAIRDHPDYRPEWKPA